MELSALTTEDDGVANGCLEARVLELRKLLAEIGTSEPAVKPVAGSAK